MPSQWYPQPPQNPLPSTLSHAASAPKLTAKHVPPSAHPLDRFSPAPLSALPVTLAPRPRPYLALLAPHVPYRNTTNSPSQRLLCLPAAQHAPAHTRSMSSGPETPPVARDRAPAEPPSPPGYATTNSTDLAARTTDPHVPFAVSMDVDTAAAIDGVSPGFGQYENSTFLLDHLDTYYEAQAAHGQPPFALDALDFMAHADVGPSSRAYPPLAHAENTPQLAAADRAPPTLLPAMFQLPVLPSQNSRLYSQEHFQHKQRQQRLRLLEAHIARGYSPLSLPAATPMNAANKLAPAPTDFEPLTLPALKAQLQAAAPELIRRRSLAIFPTGSRSTKRRTPHLTPKLLAKPSPAGRSQYDLGQHYEPQHYEPQLFNSAPMAPPMGKKAHIDDHATLLGPGTLMGFTMNRLVELQSSRSPASASAPTSAPDSASVSALNSAPPMSSLSETSPVLEAMGDLADLVGKRDRIPGKKTSHKIAEQGRRVRMNQAVHELSRLIPQDFQEGITVPSKATTIELAAVYIRNLQREIDALKKEKS